MDANTQTLSPFLFSQLLLCSLTNNIGRNASDPTSLQRSKTAHKTSRTVQSKTSHKTSSTVESKTSAQTSFAQVGVGSKTAHNTPSAQVVAASKSARDKETKE